jgi:hypothetical protein
MFSPSCMEQWRQMTNWADISDWVETTNHDVVEFSHRKLMFSRGFVCHKAWGLVLGNLNFIAKLLEPRATQFFGFALCFCQYYANWEWLYDHRILWGWHRHTCTHTNTRLDMLWCVYIYIYTLKIVHIYMCIHVRVQMYFGNSNKPSDINRLTRQDDTMFIRNTMLVVIIYDSRGCHYIVMQMSLAKVRKKMRVLGWPLHRKWRVIMGGKFLSTFRGSPLKINVLQQRLVSAGIPAGLAC